jgi:GNAT superfamily N-acetyltransferase
MISKSINSIKTRYVPNKLNDVFSKHRKLGLFTFIKKFFLYTFEIEDYIVYENSLNLIPNVVETKIDSFIKKIDREEFIKMSKNNDIPYLKELQKNIPQLIERFKMNQVCYASISRERLCGYSWISANYIHKKKNGAFYLTPSDICYSFDTFVFPNFRRCGIASAIFSYEINSSRKSHYSKLLTLVYRNNKASRKARGKMGFKQKGALIVIKIFQKYKFIIPIAIKKNVVNNIESLKGVKF